MALQNYKNLFFRAYKYSQYILFAKHRKAYGVHSPFLWELMRDGFNTRGNFYAYYTVRSLKRQLLNDSRKIRLRDFGTGGKRGARRREKVKSLVRLSSVRQKYGELLFRMVNYFSPNTIVELGTSFGISSMYMASARKNAKLYTLEACPARADIASEIHRQAGLKNIKIIRGDFDDALSELSEKISKADFVFFDGNHAEKPTLRYYHICKQKASEQSVFVFDDIYWSPGMGRAWEKIRNDTDVTLSLDLFQFGLIFFRKEMPKQHYIIRY